MFVPQHHYLLQVKQVLTVQLDEVAEQPVWNVDHYCTTDPKD